jgi:lantibiotic modifying enzyme
MWYPLVFDDARERAMRCACMLVDALVDDALETENPWSAAQRALVVWEYARLTGDRRYDAEAIAEHAANLTASVTMPSRLVKGIIGVAWAFETMHADDETDDDGELDDLIGAVTRRAPHVNASYLDLVAGLVGAGVYFLRRPPSPAVRRHLEEIVYRLEETAEYLDDGIAWWTNTIFGPRRVVPGFNLGLAHGVPGIVAFLARALQHGVAPTRTARLLDGAVQWLLAQRLSDGPSRFATIRTRDGLEGPARAAWCYGDPGVALALLSAAHATGRSDWRAAALDVALHATRRSMASAEVIDASVCHGTAGLLHVFNRFYQATGDPRFARAAGRWLDRTIELVDMNAWDGVPGLDEPIIDKASSILEGKAGIALALLSAACDVVPRFDALLLADLPVMSEARAMEVVA